MSARLEELIADARADRSMFEPTLSLGSALAKKALRERRERILRRSVVALSGAAVVALLLFRAASASAVTETTPSRQEIAARALDDGGFAHD